MLRISAFCHRRSVFSFPPSVFSYRYHVDIMPVLQSSKRTLRRQRRRATINKRVREAYKEAVKAMRAEPSETHLKEAFSQLDKAAKKGVIHQNKADRLKSRLSNLLGSK